MKRIILILFACRCALAIQAPVITGIVALSDTAVRLTLHSNDRTVRGMVQRCAPSAILRQNVVYARHIE